MGKTLMHKKVQNHRYCQLCLVSGCICRLFQVKAISTVCQITVNDVHQRCVTGKQFILHKAVCVGSC